MSLFQSTVALFYVILFVLSLCTFTFAAPTDIAGATDAIKVNGYPYYIISAIFQLGDKKDTIDGGHQNNRVKRAGESKFSDAAGMSQVKVVQLIVSLISNMFSSEPVGAAHPMARRVPFAVVELFKTKVAAIFAPELEPTHDDN